MGKFVNTEKRVTQTVAYVTGVTIKNLAADVKFVATHGMGGSVTVIGTPEQVSSIRIILRGAEITVTHTQPETGSPLINGKTGHNYSTPLPQHQGTRPLVEITAREGLPIFISNLYGQVFTEGQSRYQIFPQQTAVMA